MSTAAPVLATPFGGSDGATVAGLVLTADGCTVLTAAAGCAG